MCRAVEQIDLDMTDEEGGGAAAAAGGKARSKKGKGKRKKLDESDEDEAYVPSNGDDQVGEGDGGGEHFGAMVRHDMRHTH